MRLRSALLIAATLATCATFANAAELGVGDKAPPLKPGKWVKGEPVTSLSGDKVYVVEFWATWCAPCIRMIPHLTEMQAKYGDKVVIIGQGIWERDEAQANVEPFVAKMGDKMNYHVAMDDRSDEGRGVMAETWMAAAGQEAIPTAFIVKNEKILWIGGSGKLEPVLEKVVSGEFDEAAALKEAEKQKALDAERHVVQGEIDQKVRPLVAEKKFTEAAAALSTIADAHPNAKPELLGIVLGLHFNAKQYDAAYATADQIAAASDKDAEQLNALAWTILDKKGIENRDFARAQKYANRAAELTDHKDAAILDTLARAYADGGQLEKAIETQTKAVELADGDMKQELQKTLDGYKAKAK